MLNKETEIDPKNPKEFYEHKGSKDPNFCNHAFTRLSATRVLCNKCGLGFFDNPFDPFPVEEINKQIRSEQNANYYHKNKKKDVEKSE